ncbi:hypothetical protein C5C44_11660 [Rathayibacter sp. AY1F6]|nr:hypothetical protein C5C44_11660 [Rathayibacter sp. AY1F6]
MGRSTLISSTAATSTGRRPPSSFSCAIRCRGVGEGPAVRLASIRPRAHRSVERRRSRAAQLGGPKRPALSIIARSSSVRRSTSSSSASMPAHDRTARPRTSAATSWRRTRSPVSRAADACHSRAKAETSLDRCSGVSTRSRNIRFRLRCGSSSRVCTLPSSCRRCSTEPGSAPSRSKRPPS